MPLAKIHQVALLTAYKSSNINELKNWMKFNAQAVFEYATETKNLELIKFLTKVHPVNTKYSDSSRALHILAKLGNIEAMKIFIDAGADLRLQDSDGRTALHIAVIDNNKALADFVLENVRACSPIIYEVDPVKNIIESCDNEGYSAYHLANHVHHTEMAQFLVDKGASTTYPIRPREINNDLSKISDDIFKAIEDFAYGTMLNLIIKPGAYKLEGFQESKFLAAAVSKGNVQAVYALLKRTEVSPVNIKFYNVSYLLQELNDNNKVNEILKLLLDAGAAEEQYFTASMLENLLTKNNTEGVKLLLQYSSSDSADIAGKLLDYVKSAGKGYWEGSLEYKIGSVLENSPNKAEIMDLLKSNIAEWRVKVAAYKTAQAEVEAELYAQKAAAEAAGGDDHHHHHDHQVSDDSITVAGDSHTDSSDIA